LIGGIHIQTHRQQGALLSLLLFSKKKEGTLKIRGHFGREKNMPVVLSMYGLVPEYLNENRIVLKKYRNRPNISCRRG
jgi:hypothetical protein